MQLDEDIILSGTKNALQNTWGNKYNVTSPSVEKTGNIIVYSTADARVELDSFDEIILTIVVKFLFMPVWLIKQCYNALNEIEDIDEKINLWIKIGIIWKEDSVTGQYVRPTYALFHLFGMKPLKYTNIPFNMLTHTISEEKVMFDIMSGNSDIIKREGIKIPRVSELGFNPDPNGTNVIAECDFRNPILFTNDGINELNNVENQINEGIKLGKNITPELENFRYFCIVKKHNNTGNIKTDYSFHLPDLCIPLPRNHGETRSIAIEVELSNKRYDYKESLLRYKDNNKYKTVYWLCKSNEIAQSLKIAFQEINGTGSCRMVLSEFIIPSPEF